MQCSTHILLLSLALCILHLYKSPIHMVCMFVQSDLSMFLRLCCDWQQAERRPEEFGLPELVQQYHSLMPLEDVQAAAEQPSSAFGVCSMLLRAASPQLQGQAVTLRRLNPRQASYCASLHSHFLQFNLLKAVLCSAVGSHAFAHPCALSRSTLQTAVQSLGIERMSKLCSMAYYI